MSSKRQPPPDEDVWFLFVIMFALIGLFSPFIVGIFFFSVGNSGIPLFRNYDPAPVCSTVDNMKMGAFSSANKNVTFYLGMYLPAAEYGYWAQWRKTPLEETVTIYDDGVNKNPPQVVYSGVTTAELSRKTTFHYNKVFNNKEPQPNLVAEVRLTRKGVELFRRSFGLGCSSGLYDKALWRINLTYALSAGVILAIVAECWRRVKSETGNSPQMMAQQTN